MPERQEDEGPGHYVPADSGPLRTKRLHQAGDADPLAFRLSRWDVPDWGRYAK